MIWLLHKRVDEHVVTFFLLYQIIKICCESGQASEITGPFKKKLLTVQKMIQPIQEKKFSNLYGNKWIIIS